MEESKKENSASDLQWSTGMPDFDNMIEGLYPGDNLLIKIDNAEKILRNIIKSTTIPLRVRLHKIFPSNHLLARIESNANLIEMINNEGIREKIDSSLKSLGFTFVTIDISGFSSGSMDKLVK